MRFRGDSSLFSILRPRGASASGSKLSIGRASQGSQLSRPDGEVSRLLAQNSENCRQFALLDKNHLFQLQNPKNIRATHLYEPEDYSKDHKQDLQNIKLTSRSLKPVDQPHPMRTNSAKKILEKALAYEFKLKDLGKYSKSLKLKDMNWKLKLSALGRVIPDIEQRKKILFKGSHFNTLLRLLRSTDWSQTPVYYQFIRNGRW